jgi:uncharacterized protein involved in outer membrane biogenesis
MKRLLTVLGLLLATMALAVFVLPAFIPQAYLERQLGRLLAQETGLRLEKAERLRLSIIPSLGVAVEGVSVRLPLDKAGAPVFRADRIFTAIAPRSLIERRIKVSKIVIESPSMHFQVDAGGRPNWNFAGLFGGSAPVRLAALGDSSELINTAAVIAEQPARRKPLPSIDIDIVNGSFAYQDDARRRKLGISNVNLAFRSPRASGPLTIDGTLRLQGQEVALNAAVTPPGGGGDRSAPIRIAVNSEAMATSLDGILSWSGRPHFAGSVRSDLRSGEALARFLGDGAKAAVRFSGSAFAGRLDVSGDELTLSDAVFTAPGAEGNIAVFADFGGTVQATLDRFKLHGGTAQGKLTVDARQPQAIVAGSFAMANVDSLALTKGVSGFDWLSGRADVALEIGGGGENLEAIAQTLTGKARLTVTKGAIEGLDLPRIVADAKEGNLKKWQRQADRRTPFDRLEANFVIEKGVASTSDLNLSGPNVAMAGEGKTDLARGKLNYRLKTKVTALEPDRAPAADNKGEGQAEEKAALAVPLIIKGDWDKPEISPDLENALKDKDSLVGTAKLFGKSVEKLTDGKVKADDFGKAIDQLFGKKKKKKKQAEEAEQTEQEQ